MPNVQENISGKHVPKLKNSHWSKNYIQEKSNFYTIETVGQLCTPGETRYFLDILELCGKLKMTWIQWLLLHFGIGYCLIRLFSDRVFTQF
jgi:hypothetical protein